MYYSTWYDSKTGVVRPVEWKMFSMTYVMLDGELVVEEQWQWRYCD